MKLLHVRVRQDIGGLVAANPEEDPRFENGGSDWFPREPERTLVKGLWKYIRALQERDISKL